MVRHPALAAILAAATALLLEAGCTGILGISPGQSSNGSLGSPCDVTSDRQTPCTDGQTVCTLNVCRVACASDSSCAADERCLAADVITNGNGGPASGSGSFNPSFARFGCVPLAQTSCDKNGCPEPDVCDRLGQCRSYCSPGNGPGNCASDQTCASAGSSFACFGPHDKGFAAADAGGNEDANGGGSSGGADATTGGGTCTGTPTFASCGQCQAQGCSCPGCATVVASGACVGTPFTCAECGSAYSCSPTSCEGCIMQGAGQCTGSTLYPSCASCPMTYCGTPNVCPGCALAGLACVGTLTPCSANATQNACQAQSYCTWSPPSCGGTALPCSAFTAPATCGGQGGCNWAFGARQTCAGTVTACAALSAQACSTQPGCTLSTAPGSGEDGAAGCAAPVSDDGSAACNCLRVSGPPVNIVAGSSSPGLPTGGTLLDGTYVLTRAQYYASGVGVGSTIGTAQATVTIAGGSWQEAGVLNGSPIPPFDATVATSGATLTLTRTCPDTAGVTWEFSSSGSTLTLYLPQTDAGLSEIVVETFTLQ